MTFATNLKAALASKNLLTHPWYQAWSAGDLSLNDLRCYAAQYYHHVEAFPRCISAIHSLCGDIKSRQVLLENLNDEEQGEEHHPELWLRFAEGVGEDRQAVLDSKPLPETQQLNDVFMKLARSSYAEGLGALYAYEQQVPEVATTKSRGLQSFYGITDPEVLKFFTVHAKADVFHSQATAELLEKLSPEEQEKAAIGAHAITEAMWNFLTGVQRETIGLAAHCDTIH